MDVAQRALRAHGVAFRCTTAKWTREKQSRRVGERAVVAKATRGKVDVAGNVLNGALWAGLVGYAALVAPNFTPQLDEEMLKTLLRLGDNPEMSINRVFTALFFVMGTWPGIYAALLVPTGRSGNRVPAWPFLTGSVAFGAFALLPFLALWTPASQERKGPPSLEDLKSQGPAGWIPRLLETPFFAWYTLLSVVGCLVFAASAGGDGWFEFGALFTGSKFTHVMTLDFLTLTSLAPFWIENDSRVRGWSGRDRWLVPLCCLPLLGPALYLVLRPKAQ